MVAEERTEPKPPSPRPQLRDVVREHLEEFAFLSMIRRRSLFAPDLACRQLRRFEQRLAAHWDGLVVGLPMSLAVAEEKIAAPADPWETYGALRVRLELGGTATEPFAAAIAALEPEGLPPWREALCRCPAALVRTLLPEALLDHPSANVLSTGLFALGWHGLLPLSAAEGRLRHQQPLVRYCLARAAAWSGWPAEAAMPLLAALAADQDVQVARAALWSMALLDPVPAADRCRLAMAEGNDDPFAVAVLGLIGSPEDLGALQTLTAREGLTGVALQALGDLGVPEAVEPLLPWLDRQEHGARAAAAVQAILGPHGRPILTAEGLDQRQEAWRRLQPRFAGSGRFLHGLSWQGGEDPEQEPMVLPWRRSLLEPGQVEGVKKEVPEAFFRPMAITAEKAPSLGI